MSKPNWKDGLDPEKPVKTKTLEKRTDMISDPKKSKARYKKNQLFMGSLLLISIFYAVTVLQTAFHAQKTQLETGNNDICYFNARCQNPLLYSSFLLDFNHFYSNIGYVILGVTFNLIVAWKAKAYEKFEIENKKKEEEKKERIRKVVGNAFISNDKKDIVVETNEEELVEKRSRRKSTHGAQELAAECGIPFLKGVYYSMGGAMAMEGLMSAAYHICPTTVSFQFDTTFMYTIAILIYVKLYQNRHPDSSAGSIKAYLILGAAIALEAISIYFGNSAFFWAIFCIIYILSMVCVVANIYKLDSKERMRKEKKHWLDSILFFRVYRLLIEETWKSVFCCPYPCPIDSDDEDQDQNPKTVTTPKSKRRRPLLVFISLTCIVNIGLCVFFAWQASTGYVTASNYILYLFMINMFIYLFYYQYMKYKSGEWIEWRPKLYLGKHFFIIV